MKAMLLLCVLTLAAVGAPVAGAYHADCGGEPCDPGPCNLNCIVWHVTHAADGRTPIHVQVLLP